MTAPHFEFQTPAVSKRDPQTITLLLCGETMSVDRPKQWTLGQGETVADDMAPMQQRGQALAEFVVGTFDADGWERLVERAADNHDRLTLAAYTEAVRAMLERWGEWNDHPNPHEPITVTPVGTGRLGDAITVSYWEIGLDTVHVEPPKDLLVLVVHALAARASGSGALWVVDLFLRATFPAEVYAHLMQRLRDRDDPIDIEHLDPMLSQLLEHWTAHMDTTMPANRAERRANNEGGAHVAGTLSGTLQ